MRRVTLHHSSLLSLMTPAALSQLLLLYGWFVLSAVLLFVLAIARFYQKFSGERTHYHWLLMVIALFGIAAVRYASIDQISGDIMADGLLGAGGVIVTGVSLRLYRQMTRGRNDPTHD